MPSLKLCQVFLQQPASPYSSSTTSLIILISYCRVACPFSPFFLTFNLQLHANSFLFKNLPPVIPPPPYCISNHHTSLSPPSSPCTPPSLFAATCGRSAQAVLSILVLYCQCIVASNPVKMPWEYCINLPPRLSFYTPPHLSKKSQLLGNS